MYACSPFLQFRYEIVSLVSFVKSLACLRIQLSALSSHIIAATLLCLAIRICFCSFHFAADTFLLLPVLYYLNLSTIAVIYSVVLLPFDPY